MPSASLTNANVGSPLPLCYGLIRVTGDNRAFITNPPSTSTPPYPPTGLGNTNPLMQVGFWAAGEGEWDGPDALWINGNRMFAYDANGNFIGPSSAMGTIPVGGGPAYTSPLAGTLNFFNFHPGVDTPLSGDSSTTLQDLDPLWTWFNNLVTPLCYSRVAYWGIGWTPQIGTTPGNMQPILDMRTMKCRIFDANGDQIGYQFTRNPIWHLVDSDLRRTVKPQYTIDPILGPSALTSSELGCFRWDIIAASAAYCDFVLPNGAPRFTGDYAFTAGSTLAAIQEQMLLVCRGYRQEIAGKIAYFIDQPRSSLFTLTGDMLVPATFSADDTILHGNPNRYICEFLETELPAVAQIATISRAAGTLTLDTVEGNPCAEGDLIVIGGVEDPSFDGGVTVAAVSGNTVTAAISATDTAASTGGSIGYLESRFAQRTPEAPAHIQHQLAMGQVLPPNAGGQRLKRIKVSYNYASSTWDQAMRVLLYERYRDLGLDATPYKPPVRISLTAWSESVDAAGNILQKRVPGDVITLDPTAFYEYAGEWEIIEFLPTPFQVDPQQQGGTYITQPSSGSGTIGLVLWAYDPARFTDVSGVANASFQTVPGSWAFQNGSGVGSSSWTLTGGTVTVTAPSGGYGVPSSASLEWSGVTATAPSGATLNYAVGGGTISLPGPWYVVMQDPSNTGGNKVMLYTNISSLPYWAKVVLTVNSLPAYGTVATYTL
jgi:hypothetical protein